jgi:hypothetical protein
VALTGCWVFTPSSDAISPCTSDSQTILAEIDGVAFAGIAM